MRNVRNTSSPIEIHSSAREEYRTAQQATRRDMKNIKPGNYMDTWGKENEITRARIRSRYKDTTAGKHFLINNGLWGHSFQHQQLENAGQMQTEENYTCKCQQLLEQKWEARSLHWVIVTVCIYCVTQKSKVYRLYTDIIFRICRFSSTKKQNQTFQSEVSRLIYSGINWFKSIWMKKLFR